MYYIDPVRDGPSEDRGQAHRPRLHRHLQRHLLGGEHRHHPRLSAQREEVRGGEGGGGEDSPRQSLPFGLPGWMERGVRAVTLWTRLWLTSFSDNIFPTLAQ